MRNKTILGWALFVIGFLVVLNGVQTAGGHMHDIQKVMGRVLAELFGGVIVAGAGIVLRTYTEAEANNGFTESSEEKAYQILGKVKTEKKK